MRLSKQVGKVIKDLNIEPKLARSILDGLKEQENDNFFNVIFEEPLAFKYLTKEPVAVRKKIPSRIEEWLHGAIAALRMDKAEETLLFKWAEDKINQEMHPIQVTRLLNGGRLIFVARKCREDELWITKLE